MQEVTRQTTEQLDKARLANRPEKVRQDEMNRVLDALESHPFRKALISQHLEVKEISQPVNGRVIVMLGSLAGEDAVKLELLTEDASAFEDKNLVFEFMLAPRRVVDDTLKAGNSGHGPEADPILENPIETQEAAVIVAMPEKEHITQTFIGEGAEPATATGVPDGMEETVHMMPPVFVKNDPPERFVVDGNVLSAPTPTAGEPNPDYRTPEEDEQARERGGVE